MQNTGYTEQFLVGVVQKAMEAVTGQKEVLFGEVKEPLDGGGL